MRYIEYIYIFFFFTCRFLFLCTIFEFFLVLDFNVFFCFFSSTRVTTEHKKYSKTTQKKCMKKPLAEGQSPPQELEVVPRSRPYLLVFSIHKVSVTWSNIYKLLLQNSHFSWVDTTTKFSQWSLNLNQPNLSCSHTYRIGLI